MAVVLILAILISFVAAAWSVILAWRIRNLLASCLTVALLFLTTCFVVLSSSFEATELGLLSWLALLTSVFAFLGVFFIERFAGHTYAETRRQRNILGSILENMSDAVVVADETGKFLEFNRAAQEIVGVGALDISREEWPESYGLYQSDGVTPFAPEDLPLARAMRGEIFDEVEVIVRNEKKQGGTWISVNGRPLLDAGGRLRGGVVVFRDISKRKKAERTIQKSQERFRALADNLREVLYIYDGRGSELHYVSPPYAKVWGRSPASLHSNPQDRFEAIVEDDRERVLEAWTTRVASGGFSEEYRIERPDGAVRWIWDRGVPVMNARGRVSRIVGIAEDITERKQMLHELTEKEALARLGELGTVVAHEVRNPLAGISGALSVIGDHLPGESPDRSIIKKILGRLEALNHTVNDLLVFARPRRPEPVAVPVQLLIKDSLSLLAKDPVFRGIDVSVTGADPKVLCDAELVKPVFVNFLLNAAQAMQGEGTIDVAVSTEDGNCRIAFRDRGPGIPEEMRERIFEPFFTTKPAGTGLGLSIARRVIEQHGGSVEVHGSESEGGASIEVQLPLGRA